MELAAVEIFSNIAHGHAEVVLLKHCSGRLPSAALNYFDPGAFFVYDLESQQPPKSRQKQAGALVLSAIGY